MSINHPSSANSLPLMGPTGDYKPAVDLHRHIALFRRRLRLFAAIAFVITLAVLIFTLQMTPYYTASARLMIDPRHEKILDAEQVLSGLPTDSVIVDTEVEVLKSRALAEKVVATLHLDKDPEFNSSLAPPSVFQTTLSQVLASLRPKPAAEEDPKASIAEKTVDAVQKRLSVARSGLTYVIDISFQSRSPKKAAAIANQFADRYLLEQLDAKFDATKRASDWLNAHLAGLRDQVRTAEMAVETYKAANGLMGLADAQGATMTQQEISSLDTQLATARVEQAEAEAKLATAKSQLARGSTGEDVGEALNSQVVQDLRKQRAEVSGLLADLGGRYGPRHPEMMKAQRKLADIDAQIQAEIRRIISNLEAEAQVAKGRTTAILANLAQARGTLVTSNAASVRLNELTRSAESVRNLYQSFLDRFKQTTAEEGIQQSDARIISRAKVPTLRSSPNLPLNLVIGIILGVSCAFGAVFLIDALEYGLYTAEDVEKFLDLPLIGSIPLLESTLKRRDQKSMRPVDFIVEKPLSSFAEAFRSLRASIQFSKAGGQVKVVAISSSLPTEGKTTTSFCLGRVMAMSGMNVVLVDCDLRHRAASQILKQPPKIGLLDVLLGTALLEKAIVGDDLTTLSVLPLTNADYTPKDLFSGSQMDSLLDQLRQRFDMVLLDTAPVLPVADTHSLALKSDVVLLLARWRKTPRKAVEKTIKQLQTLGAVVAGVALTKVDVKEQARSGYGDAGYYYKAYRRYYST